MADQCYCSTVPLRKYSESDSVKSETIIKEKKNSRNQDDSLFTVVHQNIQSLRNKIDDLLIFLFIECSAIEIKSKKLIIINIYRPPCGDIDDFINILDDIFQDIEQMTLSKILLTGDFNIDLGRQDKDSRTLLNTLTKYNLKPTIMEPTRVTPTLSTIIDNIFTNLIDNDYKSSVLISSLSDHYAQVIAFTDVQIQNEGPSKIERRSFGTHVLELIKQARCCGMKLSECWILMLVTRSLMIY